MDTVKELNVAALVQYNNQPKWGRNSKAKLDAAIGSAALIAFCPLLMFMNWATLEYFGGSLFAAINTLNEHGLVAFAALYLPEPSMIAVLGYTAWLLWQALLYGYLPGPICLGQRTPGGNLLRYKANGLMAWALTHLLYLTGSVLGIIDPAVIAKNWAGLLIAANTYGFLLAIFVQVKGYWFPSFPEDRKLTGYWVFDFFAGVELNPRLGNYWDFKFFHNGRPGIIAWTLIDLSWAAYQHQRLGYVTNSLLLVCTFHAIYVVDFFYNEDWYVRTIDITHDHFGFMLAWGSTTFLPAFYTLQAQYLARYPAHLPPFSALAILALGLTGYAVFRSANAQRDRTRAAHGATTVWGRPAAVIRASYRTHDGKQHVALLLASGWWGIARHANYLADLVQAFAMCAACGMRHALPWSYFVFMCVFLHHRAGRDERRCRAKYGAKWEEYCELVRYRVIPGVY